MIVASALFGELGNVKFSNSVYRDGIMFGQNEMPGNLIMSFGGEVRVPVPESLLYVFGLVHVSLSLG